MATEEERIQELREKEAEKGSLSISDTIELALLQGVSRDELEAQGFKHNSIRTVASLMKGTFGREFGKEPIPVVEAPAVTTEKGKSKPAESKPVVRATSQTAKGMPIELLIDGLELPSVTLEFMPQFEKGVRTGLGMAVLGIRMAQELSALGITQAQPIIKMAESMRQGEKIAAQSASAEAAMAVGQDIRGTLGPVLAEVASRIDALDASSRSASPNPMASMMARVLEPQMTNMMNRVFAAFPAVGGGMVPPTTTNPAGASPEAAQYEAPPGWTHRVEESSDKEE